MINIGVICPSDIAYRRFMPALSKNKLFYFVGIAIANVSEWENSENIDSLNVLVKKQYEKAEKFCNEYGGKIFSSYCELIKSTEIDAIYFPLPPSLHYKWAKLALENNKHIFLEKPATTSLFYTKDLIELASQKNLAVHENYMFVYHNQLTEIKNIIDNNDIGEVRLYRISFGFPKRNSNDFRYNKEMGGGALMDCGGYTIKYASMLLGDTAEIVNANVNFTSEFEVEIFGSAVMKNNNGLVAQIAFGMDNSYKCDLEVWGSKGYIKSDRILTAPVDFLPQCSITIDNKTELKEFQADDTFLKSISRFQQCIEDELIREDNYRLILKQAHLVDNFLNKIDKN